mmetsp:Transcript_26122/g.50789  ORF Transcript_26122/g.50789 Transcript_26122/m.50789 type:complete len:90 (+) Transcript_26122:180-449(+)
MRGWQPDSTGTARDVHSVGSEEETGFARGRVECCNRGDAVVKQVHGTDSTLATTTIIFVVAIAITLAHTPKKQNWRRSRTQRLTCTARR